MKYNHTFKLVSKTPSSRIYYADGKYVQLDFFSHVLRVAIYQNKEDLFPTFSICPGTSFMPKEGRNRLSNDNLEEIIQEKEDEFKIDDITIKVDLNNFFLSYYKNGQLLFKDREIIAYNFEGELGKGSYHYLSRNVDEHIYGLGDKTGPVNKNMCHFKLETFDALGFDANKSDPLYKQIPFYICKNNVGSYGIYYDTYSNGEIDFGHEHNNYFERYKYVHFEEENLVYYVIFGNVEQIIERFTYLTGKSYLPPKWSFEYCASTMAYTDSDKPLVAFEEFKQKLKEYDIKCGGFYLSSGYTQIGDKRCTFNWNYDKFPDPKAFSTDFKKLGIHFLPNVKPAFLTTHPMYEYIAKNGWFLHYKDGTPYIFPYWGGMGSYLDFTNPDAYKFWSKNVKEKLVDLGFESIWNDNNEYDIHDEDVYAYGWGKEIKAKLIRPLFSYLMISASNDALPQDKRHMAVTRSACAGFQRIVQTWTGDNSTSFKDFRGNHKMAMTASLTGFSFIGQDIGGFAGPKPSKELFLRWIAYGIFTPRFTLHSWNDDKSSTMPWLYPEVKNEVKKLFALRKSLTPYIYSSAMDAVENYHPLIYPIFLKYEDFDEESDMFFCGNSIIACPIFDEGKTSIDVTLPQGNWYYNKVCYQGNVHFENKPGDLPIYFIKEGSIIPLDINDDIVFEIYPLKEGSFKYKYYQDDSSNSNPYIEIEVISYQDKVIVKGLTPKEKISLVDKRNLVIE
jgi:alpha-glucosidase